MRAKHFRGQSLALAIAATFLTPWFMSQAQAAGSLASATSPLAGALISNVAVGEYTEAGSTVVQTSQSNLVQTTILPVYAFRLDSNQTTQAAAGSTVTFYHDLRNTGNATDSYALTLANATGDGFDYQNLQVYYDRDHNGVADGLALTAAQLASISAQAGETVGLLITAVVPVGTTSGLSGNLTVSATSSSDNTLLTLSNTDTIIVKSNAIVALRKSFSVAQTASGSTVTIRLSYANTGSVASGATVITDKLDNLSTGLGYVIGTGYWSYSASGMTDAAGGDPAGIDYSYDSVTKTVSATLSSIPANSQGYIEFQVTVTGPAGVQQNKASLQYDDDNNTGTPVLIGSSNIAAIQIPDVYGVSLNASTSSSSGTDSQTLPSVPQGGVVTFNQYVWNTGNRSDTFNLSLQSSNLPAGSVVDFLQADGITPLLDSNGDGLPDTGTLASGSAYPLVVRIRFPASQADQPAQDYTIVPLATSTHSSSTSDPTTDTVQAISSLLVDLANTTPVSGSGNGVITNAGNPLKTLSVTSGSSVVFPLTISHTGTPTRYTLLADSDTNFNAPSLPPGVQVTFYESANGTDCSSLGNVIGQTRVLNNAESQLVCAQVATATGLATSTHNIYFRAVSATYADNGGGATNPGYDTILDAISITGTTSVAGVSFNPDLRGEIAPGGTIVYSHLITNFGQTALTSTQPFTVTNSESGFVTTLYYDANNNGVIDSTDPMVTDLDSFVSNGAIGLDPGESIRLLIKVENTAINGAGIMNNTVVKLLDSTGTLLGQVNDLTTVRTYQIRLLKLQALDATCDGVPDGTFSAANQSIGYQANGQAQCVIYRLIVSNEGASAIAQFRFDDTLPKGLNLIGSPTTNYPRAYAVSGTSLTLQAGLNPGESYYAEYRAQLTIHP